MNRTTSIAAIIIGLALIFVLSACDRESILPGGVLSAPTNLIASATSSTIIHLSWTAVLGATGYNIFRSTSASGTYTTLTGTITSNGANVPNLNPSTTYYFKVSAYNSYSEGPQSSYASATTWSSGGSAPNAPTNLTASATSSTRIDLSWTAVSGATGYYIYRSTSASGNYSKLTGTITSNGAFSYNLNSSTTYYYKVSAYNSYGEGSQSIYASATTWPSGGGTEANPHQLASRVWVHDTVSSAESVHWYSINVTAGNTYYLWWNDKDDGNGSKDGDIDVRITYPDGTSTEAYDKGWNGRSFNPPTSGTLKIRVRPYGGFSTYTGTYAIVYSTSSSMPTYTSY